MLPVACDAGLSAGEARRRQRLQSVEEIPPFSVNPVAPCLGAAGACGFQTSGCLSPEGCGCREFCSALGRRTHPSGYLAGRLGAAFQSCLDYTPRVSRLDNLTFPIVQLSLDLTSLDEALETAAIAVEAGVDWLEAKG